VSSLEQQQQPDQGPEAFLSAEERQQLQRYLKFPEEFPKEFGAWIQEYMAVNGVITQSQVQGLANLTVTASETLSASPETTGSTSFTDLATQGPFITGMADGTYLVFISAIAQNNAGAASIMGVRVNDTEATDANSGIASSAYWTNIFSAFVASAQNGNNNTFDARYRVDSASTGTFQHRRIFVLRVGN
jgi:hypothetical protein